MNEFSHSLKLIRAKIGTVLPTVLFLLVLAVSFASYQIVEERTHLSSTVQNPETQASLDPETPAEVFSQLDQMAQNNLNSNLAKVVDETPLPTDPGLINKLLPTLLPNVTLVLPTTPVIEPTLTISASKKDGDLEGMTYMSDLPQRNGYSCEVTQLKRSTVDFTATNIEQTYGTDANQNQVAGQWEDGDTTKVETNLQFIKCSDNKNPNYQCSNNDNYIAGYNWTGCVKDFPLLGYFSSEKETTENNYKNSVVKNAFLNISSSGPSSANPVTPSPGVTSSTSNPDFTVNFTNITPGTVWLTDDKSHIFQAKVPLLGGAMASGSWYRKDGSHLAILSPDLVGKETDTTGYTKDPQDDNWFSALFLAIKAFITRGTITTDPQTTNELALTQKMCTNMKYSPISKVNISDAVNFTYADQKGICEQIIDAGNFEISKNDLCDKELIDKGNTTGKITGAQCTLNVTGYGYFTFDEANIDLRIRQTPLKNNFADYDCQKNIPISLCNKDFTCGDKVIELYKQCRNIGQDITDIKGDPKVEWNRDNVWNNLTVKGLNKYLVNVQMEENSFMNPDGIGVVREDVGIRLNTCFSVYNLQDPNMMLNDAENLRTDLEKEFLGRQVNEAQDNIFNPQDTTGFNSDKANQIKNLNIDNPVNYLAKFVQIDPTVYNPMYSGGFNLAKNRNNDRAQRVCLTYFIPFVGQIPRGNERIAYNWNELFAVDTAKSVVDGGIAITGVPATSTILGLGDYNWREALTNKNLAYILIPKDTKTIDLNEPNQDYIYTNSSVVDPMTNFLGDMGLGLEECIPPGGNGMAGVIGGNTGTTPTPTGSISPTTSVEPTSPGGGGGGGSVDLKDLVSPLNNVLVTQCYGPTYNDGSALAKKCIQTFGTQGLCSNTTSPPPDLPNGEHTCYYAYLGYFHNGIDMGIQQTVYAAGSGVVFQISKSDTGYGNQVIVKHTDSKGKTFYTRYAHLASIAVAANAQVFASTKIGEMGTTGNSTGIHLHFEINHCANAAYQKDCTDDPTDVVLRSRKNIKPNKISTLQATVAITPPADASNQGILGTVRNKFNLPICSPVAGNVTSTPGVTGGPNVTPTPGGGSIVPTPPITGSEKNYQCLMAKVVNTINSDNYGPKIPWEALYAITKQESGLRCNMSHYDYDLNKNGKIEDDPNKDGNKIDTEFGWYNTSYPLCDGNPNNLALGVDSNYDPDHDVRGVTQFNVTTFDIVVANSYPASMPSDATALINKCLSDLGITQEYRNQTQESKINREKGAVLSKNPDFSRARVSDALCATSVMLSDFAGLRANNGKYIKPENWTDDVIKAAAYPYQGDCSSGYCDSVVRYFNEAKAMKLNCN